MVDSNKEEEILLDTEEEKMEKETVMIEDINFEGEEFTEDTENTDSLEDTEQVILEADSISEAHEKSILNGGAEVLINRNNSLGDTDEGDMSSAIKINSKIYIRSGMVNVDDIALSEFKKSSRTKTVTGLTGVVGEWGVVTPIHVMELSDGVFMVLDGSRRIFGAIRNNIDKIPAQIWRFEDKKEGKNKANLISLMLNRSQGFRASEMWEQMKILETVNNASPSLIEYLLQMQSGQAMKLKDVMLSDDDYFEIRESLLLGEIDIETAYKKLCAERKKENQLEKEDAMVIDGGVSEDGEGVDDEQRLSTEAVKDLLEINKDIDIDDETLESLNKVDEAKQGDYVQDPNNREKLDPELRNEVLERDNFTCQCCGEGGQAYLAVLTAHHIIEVVQGGPDTVENLVTLCVKCHILLHTYAWGKISVDLNTLDEEEKQKFKKIFKYGNVIIEADKKLGRTHKGVNPATKHPFPGAELGSNKKAFEVANKNKKDNEEESS